LLTRKRGVDWFEKLTGFPETNYVDTRAKLAVEGERLRSLVNGKSYGVGRLELVSLETLRQRTNPTRGPVGKLRVSLVSGNVREMHRRPENLGALFQVASQFNLLEMIGPDINPEHGVTRYQNDPTQGPACAIAAGAATIYRNYFAPVAGLNGQTKERQIDGLAPLGEVLSESLKQPVEVLWKMQNGYALCTRTGLNAISEHITSLRPERIDALRGELSVGIHSDVEVTDGEENYRPLVSQIFCSALPIAYTHVSSENWQPFASLVLDAAYEATMLATLLNARRGASNVVLLTFLGGGAFGNADDWIYAAIRRSLKMMSGFELDVRLVSYGTPSRAVRELVNDFG
jgi:hypothetical protein